MNSLREIIEASPSVRHLAFADQETSEPQPLAVARWDWSEVKRVLVIRLRSIGDTVLTTPTLFALRRFVPDAQIDVLLEDWVAPVFDGLDVIDRVIVIPKESTSARARIARELRTARYDVVYNLHGGTTATFLTRATGAKHRVGFENYQYARLHNHVAPSPLQIWQRPTLHSVEQQLALIGWTGVPVTDRPPTRLGVTESALRSASEKLRAAGFEGFDRREPFALIHPTAAFDTKQWAMESFARVAEGLSKRNLNPIVVVAPHEKGVADVLQSQTSSTISLHDLSLPQVTALASRARLFVGNDSGIAHIAAAAGASCIVIFGTTNRNH